MQIGSSSCVEDHYALCRSTEDVEDVRREVQIMHHLAGHPNVTLLKGAYEDRHHVHLVSCANLQCICYRFLQAALAQQLTSASLLL